MLKEGIKGFNEYLKKEYDGDAIHFNISNSIDMIYVYLAKILFQEKYNL